MNAGNTPRKGGESQRLLAMDPDADVMFERTVADLPTLLAPGDVVVLNDAATIPASLRVRTANGRQHELRLAGPPRASRWPAVLFGEGDWRADTDHRPAPDVVRAGDRLRLDDDSTVRIVAVSDLSPRLLTVHFERSESDVWPLLYRLGRPVQYAYVTDAVALPDVQTSYAGRPWAVEMPSAGRPLTWNLLLALRRRGVAVVTLTLLMAVVGILRIVQQDPHRGGDKALPLPDVMVDPDGRVSHVWLLNRIEFTPPVPGFDDAIVSAIRQWRFEPFHVGGEPVAFCMHVSSNVHWWK